jgi:hypothetical protein
MGDPVPDALAAALLAGADEEPKVGAAEGTEGPVSFSIASITARTCPARLVFW